MKRAIVCAVFGACGCSVSTEPIDNAFDSVGVGSTGSPDDDGDDDSTSGSGETGSPTGDPSTTDDPSTADDPSAADDDSTDADASATNDPSAEDESSSDPSAEGESSSDASGDPSVGDACGDDVASGNEDCDGSDLGTGECADFGWLGGGALSCDASCSYDDAECVGPLCGEADDGVGACPPECSSCEDGFCIFDCPGNIIDGGPCNGLDLVCPAGWPCRLMCGDAGCVDTTYACSDGVCEIDCDGIDACDGTTVACGLQSCTATCDIFTEPELDCGTSCACTPC